MTVYNFHLPETWYFSNFYPYMKDSGVKIYPVRVVYEGLTFDNTESAYMASKMADPKDRIQFVGMHPKVAKKLTHSGAVNVRADWEQVKVSIMEDLVRQKFLNTPELAAVLLNTGDEELVEGNTWGDVTWGMVQDANGKWCGQNHLGRILMKVRSELRVAQNIVCARPLSLGYKKKGGMERG